MARRKRRNPTVVTHLERIPRPSARDLADPSVTFGDAMLVVGALGLGAVAIAWLLRRPATPPQT